MFQDFINRARAFFSGFTVRNEQFLFSSLPKILAVVCLIVAAYYAWKLAGQLNL